MILLLPSCGEKEAPEGPTPKPYNVVLISLDTLRADHLGVYGYNRPVSPRIDAFARRSIRFEHAYSHAPWTTPSHAALLTSLYPTILGLKKYPEMGAIGDRVETMAEYFKAHGYRTYAVTEGGMVHADFGFGQGFEKYFQSARHVDHGTEEALKWLGSGRCTEPFFLFFHTYDIHRYEPPAEYLDKFRRLDENRLASYPDLASMIQKQSNEDFVNSLDEKDLTYLIDLYDASIRWVDHYVGLLLDDLEKSGRLSRTIVVITSDHGEEFLERNRTGHGYSNYEEQIHVPLIVYYPEASPGVRKTLIQHIDLLPTLADALGFEPRAEWLGESLLKELMEGDGQGSVRQRFTFCEGGHLDHKSLESMHWKFIQSSRGGKDFALFDLATDPKESRSVLEENEEVGREMKRRLDQIIRTNNQLAPNFAGEGLGDKELPQELLDQLRKLGYTK